MTEMSILCFNSRVLTYSFDGASSQPMLVCELPTKQPNSPVRYLVPVDLVALLRLFNGSTETDLIIREYITSHKQYSAEKLNSLVHQYFVPKGLLLPGGAEFCPPATAARRQSYMYLRKTLLSANFVAFLSKPVSWLFQWRVVLALIPLFVATQIFYFSRIFSNYHFNLNSVTGIDFALLMLITSGLGLFHELGHAAALNHFGHRRASIGWGLYLSLTVFYADLSDAWRLKRLDRALVDIGGIYFHLITLMFLLAFILLFHFPVLVYCFFFVDIQIAGALNPFLRMDGYWLVSDLFGIADLRRECALLLEHLLWRLFRIPAKHGSFTQLSERHRVFLIVYLLCGGAFGIYLYEVLFAQLAFIVLPGYPKLLVEFWRLSNTHPVQILTLMNLAGAVIFRGLMLYGFFRMIYRLVRRSCTWTARTFNAYRSRRQVLTVEAH
jgi:putative peptide zinc metalloprotease protein